MINVSNTYLDCLEQTVLLLVIPFSTKHYLLITFYFRATAVRQLAMPGKEQSLDAPDTFMHCNCSVCQSR